MRIAARLGGKEEPERTSMHRYRSVTGTGTPSTSLVSGSSFPFPLPNQNKAFEFARYPEESRPTSRPLLSGGVHREPFGGVRPEPDEEETMGKLYTIRAFVFYTCPVRTISCCACLLDRERRPRRYRFVALSSNGALEKVLIRLYG